MNLSTLVQTFRLVKKAELEERRQKEFAALSATPLNVGIIQDLVNSAAHGVVIDVTLGNGERLQITRKDPYSQLVDRETNREFVGGL